MKSIIIIIHVWVLLLTIVSNGVEGKEPGEILNIVNQMANHNDSIPGIFKPSKNGFLGGNRKSFVYKGTLLPKPMEVSMKFTTDKNQSENEYRIYTYLKAINKEGVEVYGIPSIHYYGKWVDCFIMAMTLLDPQFHQGFRSQNYTEIDILIILREFVRVTKYTHSRSIFLHNIDFTHIIFRKQHGFIYDFIAATKSNATELSLKLNSARVDWQQFLRAMYEFIRHGNHWSWLEFGDDDSDRKRNIKSFASSLHEDSQLEEFDESVKFTGLRKVFVEFTRYAYGDDETSTTQFYNWLYEVIGTEIKKYTEQPEKPAIPSWLPNDHPIVDATSDTIAPIESIREPYEPGEIAYDEVDYEFFHKRYPRQPSSSSNEEKKCTCLDCLK